MKKILYTTTAFILCGLAQSQAACIATPSCTTLGYTSTSSCTNGLKCPFGNYWNCDLANKIDELEQKIEQSQGGSGGSSSTCKIGSILYSDKTCSAILQSGKTPIGVVVYADEQGYGYALALKSIGSYKWSAGSVEVPGLMNYSSSASASTDFASCANSKIIMAAGDKSTYPAVWAANEYSTEGTNAGDWCLPAAGILASYYNNSTAINIGYARVSGTSPSANSTVWSSTELNQYYAHGYNINETDGQKHFSKDYSYSVYPVLEF